jgi:hypothetical protein
VQARAQLARACTLGLTLACVGGDRDPARGCADRVSCFHACAAGDGAACTSYVAASGDWSHASEMEVVVARCRGVQPDLCPWLLGGCADRATECDPAALRATVAGCRAGQAVACARMAELDRARAVITVAGPIPPAPSWAALTSARCDGGDWGACGVMARAPRRTVRGARALGRLAAACAAEDVDACQEVAISARNSARAQAARARVCKLRGASCEH